jgi:RNA polymerase sigma-70 factor, ECF subfamily
VESPRSVRGARLVGEDERALDEAFRVHGPALCATARGVLGDAAAAQDVVQDVLVDLWCHPERFDPALGSLRAFLLLRARHRAQDVVRSEQRRTGRERQHQRLAAVQRQPSVLDEVITAETAAAVRAAVRRLPPDQCAVVQLAYFDGLSYRAAAHEAGVPEGTAKSRVRLALAVLGTVLDRRLLEPS